jgi:mono/diheme cytochrome c family protein
MARSRGGRAVATLLALVALGAGAFPLLTRLRPWDGVLPVHTADLANGETMFHAAACLWCHAPPEEARDADRTLPTGGAPFKTPVGTFYPGNLTPDPETGLGRWSERDFINAMKRGLAPDGTHYFPAFPYPSYAAMRVSDLRDLRAYLMALPAVRSPRREPEMRLEWLARRGVGLWKRLALRETDVVSRSDRTESWNRGAYLVRAPGHCGECHTPRDRLMVSDERRYLGGGPHPGGEGDVPSLRGLVARERYKDAADLALALQFGETYGYDKLSSGGMGAIQESLARLPEHEIQAVAEYLVALE